MQRLRVRYAKRGRMRFTSHRDFSRAFERAVFRARLPVAYSSGFNPHPRISYAGAAPTGAASEEEYLEIALAKIVNPAAVREQLDEVMPSGLDIVDVLESTGGALAEVLTASRWVIDIDVPRAIAVAAAEAFLAADAIVVQRMTKRGMREFDCRAAVLDLEVDPATPALQSSPVGTRLGLSLRHVEPAVRPDDVITGLRAVAAVDLGTSVPLLTRLSQGPLQQDGTVGDPLRRSE